MEKGLFFDGVEYGAGDMVSYLGHMCTDGVIMDAETSLKVVSSGGLSVRVQPGVAYISGYCYVVDSGGVTLTTTSGTRTDIVVVKLDFSARTMRAVIKQGETDAGSNEIPLARLAVSGGTVTVTDVRPVCRLKNQWADLNAPGTVQWFAAQTPPYGWLECNGSAVSRVTYANLFAVIGTTYGAGDGSTTFHLPDLRGEFIRGWDHQRDMDKNRIFGSVQESTLFGGAAASDGYSHIVEGREMLSSKIYSDYGSEKYSSTGRFQSRIRPHNVALLPIIKY